MSTPSAEELMRRKKLLVGSENVRNQASTDFPGHWPGEDHEWDLEHFKNTFEVEFHEHKPFDNTFSLKGLDTSVANALRRILLAEIPTVAIDDVFIFMNTSVIQDEVLAQRMGLIPLCGDREALNSMTWYKRPTDDDEGSGNPSDYNTLCMTLEVACEWQEGGLQRATAGETNPDKLSINHNVYARDLKWLPIGNQAEKFASSNGIRSTNPDILIAKLRPGQAIRLKVHAMKGIGQDHAKFSPVATATYRLLPTIDILQPIIGAEAKKFARCFPKGVIKLEPVTSKDVEEHTELEGKEGEVKAVVDNAMNDTVSRECLRHPEFANKVRLGRVRDHFIFKIESVGQYESDELFLESVKVLKVKCQRAKRAFENMTK